MLHCQQQSETGYKLLGVLKGSVGKGIMRHATVLSECTCSEGTGKQSESQYEFSHVRLSPESLVYVVTTHVNNLRRFSLIMIKHVA